MLSRYSVGAVLGVVVTGMLFYIMQALIADDRLPFSEPKPPIKMTYLQDIPEDVLPVREKKVEPPPPVEAPPKLPKTPKTGLEGGVEIGTDEIKVPPIEEVQIARYSDGTYLPIVKVSPQYPSRARSRGIEGYVTLEFTVTKTGSVENPIVVDSEPAGVFDRAAKKAVLRFKYKPKVVAGEPVSVNGVTNLIRFTLTGQG